MINSRTSSSIVKKTFLLFSFEEVKAIMWKTLSCACFATINALVRYLTGGSPIAMSHSMTASNILFWQNLIATALIIIFWNSELRNIQVGKEHYKFHFIRIFTAVLGILLWYVSLKFYPVAQVVALSFLAPVLTVLGARIFLKENISTIHYLAIIFCFFGSGLILRPDKSLFLEEVDISIIFPLCAACCFAISKISTRVLASKKVDSKTLTATLLIFMTPVTGILNTLHFSLPHYSSLMWILCLALLALGAHYAFAKSLSLANISFLTPVGVIKIIFSLIIGYICFGEFPNNKYIISGLVSLTLGVSLLSFKDSKIR